MSTAQKTYLALGDSYTICEGLNYENTWPYHLSSFLTSNGYDVNPPKIIAKTGWRTDELISAAREGLNDEKFDMVSLLIGVNNEYQGKPFSQYEEELKTLVDIAIEKCKNDAKGVFMLSIPDYGVTPFAIEKNKTEALKTLQNYNAYAKSICETYNIQFYDITELSIQLSKDERFLHTDKLHPNEKQYLEWINTFKSKLLKHLRG